MSQDWDTDDGDISDKVEWLELNLNKKIDGLYKDIATSVSENKKLNKKIETAFNLQDENLKNVRNWIGNKFPDDINTI
jgi:SMC interacting uncharacterized protein involved in chromosome segregation